MPIEESDISVLWFSQISDYDALKCSFLSVYTFLPNNNFFVSLDDEEKIYLTEKESHDLNFLHSKFDQNKFTGGIDRVVGYLLTYQEIFFKTGNPLILKIDADMICTNRNFLNLVDENSIITGQWAREHSLEYQYGGAYLIDCSKINFNNIKDQLLELDKEHDCHFSGLGWPEDKTIYYFCLKQGKNKLLKKTDSPTWMNFWNYKLSLSEILETNWDFPNHPASFINTGYNFQSKSQRNMSMASILLRLLEFTNLKIEKQTITLP